MRTDRHLHRIGKRVTLTNLERAGPPADRRVHRRSTGRGRCRTHRLAGRCRPACDNRNNNTVAKLTECVTVDGVLEHQKAFQAIADANGDTGLSGTPGYDASADYVRAATRGSRLRGRPAGVRLPLLRTAGQLLQPGGPAGDDLPGGHRLRPDDLHRRGSVDDGAVTPVDPGSGNSGCEAADFAGFPWAVSRSSSEGAAHSRVKAANAEAADAAAVVIVNNVARPLNGTLGAPGVGIPVVGVPTALGRELASPAPRSTWSSTRPARRAPPRTSWPSCPAEVDNVVMAGAHLDSVLAGPGINDNGSGSAAILDVAESMAKVKPDNTVRVRVVGRRGARPARVDGTTSSRCPPRSWRTSPYLNFDMVGSPNFARFIYDGDQSDFVATAPVPARAPLRSIRPRGLLRASGGCSTRAPSSAVAATTRPSSTTASRPAACSPARKAQAAVPGGGLRPRPAPRTTRSTRPETPSATWTWRSSTRTRRHRLPVLTLAYTTRAHGERAAGARRHLPGRPDRCVLAGAPVAQPAEAGPLKGSECRFDIAHRGGRPRAGGAAPSPCAGGARPPAG